MKNSVFLWYTQFDPKKRIFEGKIVGILVGAQGCQRVSSALGIERIGEQLGNYRLLRLLGRGGFAEVYLGEHIYLKSLAALKVLHTQLADEEAKKFIQEAQRLAHLNHPNIVRVLDFAVQDGRPFLVTEYAAHGTLRMRHPRGVRVPLGPLISYVQQVASALQYAHDQHLIYRDIKPENMLVGMQQEVLLGDFGLAIFMSPMSPVSSADKTKDRSLAGSAPYMAPEQLRGEPGPASDQYALGVVVYEWLCGKRPFDGSGLELAKHHFSLSPPSLRLLLPTLSPAIEYVVLRALSKEPGKRFPSVQDFANALYVASQEAMFSSSTRVADKIATGEFSAHVLDNPDFPDVSVQQVIVQETALLEPVTNPTQPMDEITDSADRSFDVQPVTQPGQLWNVPTIPTSLLGRAQEVMATCALLQRPDVRLLSLLGTGGIGKTRLSIQIATELRPAFADGVCFVVLAAIREPEMVMPSILHALGLQQKEIPSLEYVKSFLLKKHLLLVLDNFEQVVAAAPQIEALLAACPGVKVLVTSRIALRVAGEQHVQLPPLPLPDISQLPSRTAIAQYASVMLFVQRAQALLPTFEVTQANAKAIAEICVRLDGLPLAIELAAARVKLLPPPALLARLSNRLQVLTKGVATLPERQQTLRNTIQWSYDLLNEREQRLFRRLSAYVSGCTLRSIEALYTTIAGEQSESAQTVLDDVETLIDNSLLQMTEQEGDAEEPRLLMLETIREYGQECLQASEEMEAVQQAHALYYLLLAEQAAKELQGEQQVLWGERLERDYDNIRAAIGWALAGEGSHGSHGSHDTGNTTHSELRRETALRLSAALEHFWLARGYLREGWNFIERALAQGEHSATPIYAHALSTASRLISFLGDLERADALLEQSLVLYREIGDQEKIAYCLRSLGWTAHSKDNFERAHMLYEESLAIFREIGNKKGIGDVLLNMGYLLQFQGANEQARVLFEEFLTIQRERKNKQGIANGLFQLAQLLFATQENPPLSDIHALLTEAIAMSKETGDKYAIAHIQRLLGKVAYSQGDLMAAHSLLEQCIQFYRDGGDWQGTGQALLLFGTITTAQGGYEQARKLFEESMEVAKNAGNSAQIIVEILEGMAGLAMAQSQNIWAVRLWSAATKLREDAKLLMWPLEKATYERSVQTLHGFFGEKMFSALWEEARTMSPEEVFSTRGAAPPSQKSIPASSPTPVKTKAPAYPAGLSAREVEVLRLVAQGLTDIQIAEQLIISPRTVTTHLTSIYNKLGVASRTAATRFAIERHLV